MTGPSDWPLPPAGVRFVVPHFLLQRLTAHPLTHGLYPRAMGYYPEALGQRVHTGVGGQAPRHGQGQFIVHQRGDRAD